MSSRWAFGVPWLTIGNRHVLLRFYLNLLDFPLRGTYLSGPSIDRWCLSLLHYSLPCLSFLEVLLLLMEDSPVFFMNSVCLSLMDHWLMNLVQNFLLDYWLVNFCDHWLVVLVDNVLSVLFNDVPVVLMDHILVLPVNDRLRVFLLIDWGLLSGFDNFLALGSPYVFFLLHVLNKLGLAHCLMNLGLPLKLFDLLLQLNLLLNWGTLRSALPCWLVGNADCLCGSLNLGLLGLCLTLVC